MIGILFALIGIIETISSLITPDPTARICGAVYMIGGLILMEIKKSKR